MVEKKRMCYYKSRVAKMDALMLREFVDFCDQEASRTIFIKGWKSKKRVICDNLKCWEKAKDDLNKLKARSEHYKAINKEVAELQKQGLSKGQAINELINKYGLAGF